MTFKRQTENNTYIDKGDYFEVTVNNSDLFYKVDREDVEWMKEYTWYSYSKIDYPYLVSKKRISGDSYKRTAIRFHAEAMQSKILEFKYRNPEYKKRIIVDHINGDCTDNRKSNLRVRTQSENNMNKAIQSNNMTGFPGVTWHKKQRMWNACIRVKSEQIELGSYYYLRNALRTRIDAEKKYFGEHSLYMRDEEYKKKVDEVLSLPTIPEPVFSKARPNSKTGFVGVSYDNKRKKKKYIAKIKGLPSKSFETLEEAIEHRKYLWKEIHGDRPFMISEDKEERLI